MRNTSNRTVGLTLGFLLGLGAPAGGLLLRMLLAERWLDAAWLASEWQEYRIFYAYMALTTPLVFMIFGGFLGGISDQLRAQQASLRKIADVLERRSITDDLTGVHNRRHLSAVVDKEIDRSIRHEHQLSGIMVDLDGFKSINDLHGHAAGDLALKDVAAILARSIRAIDTVGRYGGDEFVIVLPESGIEAARIVAERILQTVRQHRLESGRLSIPLTVSIGTAAFRPTRELTRAAFFERIDHALFEAKAQGKDRVFAAG